MVTPTDWLNEQTIRQPAIQIRKKTDRFRQILAPLLPKEQPAQESTAMTPEPAPRPWLALSPREQDATIARLFGWTPEDGDVPLYSQDMNLARQIMNIAEQDVFNYGIFVEMLSACLRQRIGLDPRIALTDMHIYTAINASDVAYAYLIVYGPPEAHILYSV